MKLYFAPMEGITGYVFRNAFHKVFESDTNKIDKYFSPFISPGVNQPLTPKELRDIHPDNNRGITLVPQILANNADDFLLAARYIKELGYEEVNLNLGCPSGTVVAKRKGSGLLAEPELMEHMLDKIYESTDMKVSVKTRIGKDSPEEFPKLMEIFNKFPLEELIVHPRVRNDFYKNTPNMDMFKLAYDVCKTRLSYNGDVVTIEDFGRIGQAYPKLEATMIGRGFLQNPLLAGSICCGEPESKHLVLGKEEIIDRIKEFHDLLLEGYIEVMSGEKPVLFKMKELWCYLIRLFEDKDKYIKKIRKAERLDVYRHIVNELFSLNTIA